MPKLAKARRAQYGGLNANHLVLRIEQLQNPLYYRYARAQARDHCSSRRTLTLKATSGYRVRGQSDIARRSQNVPTGPASAAIRWGYRGSGARTGSPQRSPSTRRRGRRCRRLAMTGGWQKVEATRISIRWSRVMWPARATSAVISSSERNRKARAAASRASAWAICDWIRWLSRNAPPSGIAPCRAPIRQRRRACCGRSPSPPRQTPRRRAGGC